jgi:hypothetical protein
MVTLGKSRSGVDQGMATLRQARDLDIDRARAAPSGEDNYASATITRDRSLDPPATLAYAFA